MANYIKKLAGETVIYGLSSVLARIINFALVPLYTRALVTAQFGVVTWLMAIIAVLQVVLTLGLETGSFRFASKEGADGNKVFSNAFLCVAAVCLALMACVLPFSGRIASSLEEFGNDAGFSYIIIYVGLILTLDCTTSVVFAKLRYYHKALKFALIRTAKIFVEIGVNLLLYLVMPAVFPVHPDHWLGTFVSSTPDFTYAVFAIFVSCVVCFLLLLPDIFRFRFEPDRKLVRKMMLYSLPLMVSQLPGVLNDFVDRLLMSRLSTLSDLGVYQAGVKIAVLMSLFTQMFRYAAEPFFFQKQKEKGSRWINVQVMNWFLAFCMLGYVVIMLYINEIGLILGKDFRVGLDITPIMLFAYVLVGVLFNVNMWYKLADKPGFAVWITLAGLGVTLLVDIPLIPLFSYKAAAWGHVASYAVMVAFTALLGRKYYHIPYNWGLILVLMAAGVGTYYISMLLPRMAIWLDHLVRALMTMLFALFAFVLVRRMDARNERIAVKESM